MKKITRILFVAATLFAASLACSIPVLGQKQEPPTPTYSVEEAQSLVEAWDQAIQVAKDTGTLNVTLTEEQMTSFLGQALSERPELPITNPQIHLREGEMEATGRYNGDPINADFSILMEVTVDADGVPSIAVTSGTIGILPVPAEILSGISDVVNQALTGQVATTATGFTLDAISITEGKITLSGTLK